MAYWSRLTPIEEDFIWVAGKALSFGERVSLEVSRVSADAVFGVVGAVSDFLPLSESAPLSSAQDDIGQSLASSPTFLEQHDFVCSEETSEDQGCQVAHDVSSDLAPESVCPTSSLACSDSLSASSSSSEDESSLISREDESSSVSREDESSSVSREDESSSVSREDESSSVSREDESSSGSGENESPSVRGEDESSSVSSKDGSASVSSPQQQRCLSKEVSLREASPAPQPSAISVPASQDQVIPPVKDQGTSLEVLVSDAALLCEQGLCGGRKETVSEVLLVQGVDSKATHEIITIPEAGDHRPFEHLDLGCLYEILSRCDDDSLNSSSLVCHDWLETSRLARRTWKIARCGQLSTMCSSLLCFSRFQKIIVRGSASKLLFDDRNLAVIAEGAPHLQHLEIEHCSRMTDNGLAGVLRGCSELSTLILFKCGGVTGSAFKGIRCKLKKVALSWCSKLTNEGLKALASACLQMCDFEMLRESGDASLACGLRELIRTCSGLVSLNLHRSGLTDRCLRMLAASCTKLNMLTLSCENDITDAGMTTFLQRSQHVQELSLVNNEKLVTVPCSRAGMPLRRLSLGWWRNVTDEKLQVLSKETDLEELHFLGCPALSNATVHKVLNSCKKLDLLVVTESSLVTPEIIESYVGSGSRATLVIEKCAGISASALSEKLRLSGRILIDQ